MINPDKDFYKDYLSILENAFESKSMVIAYCTDNITGELVAVLCASEDDEQNRTVITPYALLFSSNPFELLKPLSDTDEAIIVKQDANGKYDIKINNMNVNYFKGLN
jgi:hypothetical protein